jgi:hypothetical protein
VLPYVNNMKKKKKKRKEPPLNKRNATMPRLYISAGKEKLIKISKIKVSQSNSSSLRISGAI